MGDPLGGPFARQRRCSLGQRPLGASFLARAWLTAKISRQFLSSIPLSGSIGVEKLKPTFVSRVPYQDRGAGLAWLEGAFGFAPVTVAKDSEGRVVHAEMRFGNGLIVLGSEWGEIVSPASAGGTNTQTISVELEAGLDAHCERARAAGGENLGRTAGPVHGDRTYRVKDPEGHILELFPAFAGREHRGVGGGDARNEGLEAGGGSSSGPDGSGLRFLGWGEPL